MLNEAPNSTDATCIVNDVRLTTYHGHKIILNGGCIYSHHAEKQIYQRQEIVTQKQERFIRTEINIVLGKNKSYMPRVVDLLVWAGRQAVSE